MDRRHVVPLLVLLVVLSGCATTITPGGNQQGGEIAFRDVTNESGFDYVSQNSGIGNGNDGVFTADINGDGWTDVLTTGGERPALFVNREGNFERRDSFPRVNGTVQSALFFDYDDDGDQDLLLLVQNAVPVFLGNDDGSFEQHDVGIDQQLTFPVGATAADYDGDGCLDLFVIQSGDWSTDRPEGYTKVGQIEDDNGNRNLLFDGNCGDFERDDDAGIAGEHWSLATSFVDLTGNGHPDIHVANDYYNDTLYVNQGNGSFERRVLGPATDRNGMSSEVGFVTDDDRPDLFVTNIYIPMDSVREQLSDEEVQIVSDFVNYRLGKRAKGNSLLVSQGNGNFDDRATSFGVQHGGWGWGAAFGDFDNDGDQDLFHTTQTFVQIHSDSPVWTYPMVYERDDGTFDRRDASEVGFNETDGRGTAVFDYDRDGDLDLLVAQYNGEFKLYENVGGDPTGDADQSKAGVNSLQIRLQSSDDGPVLGTRLIVDADEETIHRVVNARSDFRSQDTRVTHIGLGDSSTVKEVRIVWPDGSERVLTDVPANHTVTVVRGGKVTSTPFPETGNSSASK